MTSIGRASKRVQGEDCQSEMSCVSREIKCSKSELAR